MDEDTAATRPRRLEAGDTEPTPPQARGELDTARHRGPKRSRRRRGWGWRLLALLLTGVVVLNLCLTTGVWLNYYAFARGGTPPLGTPPPQVAVILTALPPFQPTATPTPLSATREPGKSTGVVTVLLLGIDERPDQIGQATRTDTVMVLRADFDKGTARLLSFPRDMWVALPNLEAYSITAGRINTAYFYGERYKLPGGGPALAAATVTLNFGIRIDHFALANFDGFVKAVDALGGIDIDVPRAIYDDAFPTDDYGTVLLDVPAGPQHMDGLTALRYARTRHQDNDFERVRREQLVLLAVRDTAVSLDTVTKLPELLGIAGSSFRTDMTVPQMISYAGSGQKIERDRIETYVIDPTMLIAWRGAGGASLYIPDRHKIAPLIEAFLGE